MTPEEDEVRRRAHQLWEQEGQPEGRELEHWQQALAELEREDEREADTNSASTPSATTAATRRPTAVTR
jgi:hypothetical protein